MDKYLPIPLSHLLHAAPPTATRQCSSLEKSAWKKVLFSHPCDGRIACNMTDFYWDAGSMSAV